MADSRYSVAAITAFTRDALLACGVPPADAELAAKQMTEADVTGFDAHGIVRLGGYIGWIKSGGSMPRPTSRCCSAHRRQPLSMAMTASAIL